MTEKSLNEKHRGLSTSEVEALLKKFGKNQIVSNTDLTQLQQFLKILSDPMGLMMLGLAILYFFTNDRTDAIVILLAYIPVTAVDVFLELRSEKALKALQANLQTTAKVFRDGVLKEVLIQELVPGDVFAFEEGQSLPADGRIIESQNLSISEAALTGESLPIEKQINDEFFAGTSILNGRGLGLIEQTGKNTRFGKISHLLESSTAEKSPLQKKVHALVQKVLWIAAGLVVLLFTIEYFRGVGLLESLIRALTFGMAAVPEEFPLVFTLYLSLGAWRLSKHGVLVKTLPSVEALGHVDVICTDKTGTLTEGHFRLIEIVPFGSMSSEERETVALLACEPTPVDAMETAIAEKLTHFDSLKRTWSLQFDYPFENQGKHMTHVWSQAHGDSLLAMKGAVEGVLEHCSNNENEKKEILQKVNHLASEGKRILGLASQRGHFSGVRNLDEKNLNFVGLLVFTDPVRPSAKKAVEECQRAGIEIKMLTGDHPLTAHAIADELNIKHSHRSLYSGSQLNQMTPAERQQAYINGALFARVSPEQKHEMIQTLKKKGQIVAMTGDGVNDSPALKLADIGVSMGENATDVARSTAKMILLKNDFNGIVRAIFEGRNIFANLRRSFSYLISFHIPIILLALLPPLFAWPQLLMPIHIILLELIVHLISAFAFENLTGSLEKHEKSLVPLSTSLTSTLSGVLLSGLCLLPLLFNQNGDFNLSRAQALSILLYGNIGFMLTEAWPQFLTKRILTIAAVMFVLPLALCNIHFLGDHFHLLPLTYFEFITTGAIGLGASLPTLLIRFWLQKKNP